MNGKKPERIIIIGAGHVGAATAHALVTRDVGDEIGLIDILADKVLGEVLDLQHALPYLEASPKRIFVADYGDVKEADIVIVAAHSPDAVFNETADRLSLLAHNAKMARSITKQVMEAGFDGIFIVATNPVDIIARIVYEESRLPASRVIGAGTMLETARLKSILSEKLAVAPASINGFVMGEHGFSAFGAWSGVTVGGIPIKEYGLADAKTALDFETLNQKIRDAAYDVYYSKGETSIGIANILVRLAKAVLRDEHAVFPIGARLTGEYGLKNLYLGIPAVINRQGIRETVPPKLTSDELEKMQHCGELMEKHYQGVVNL